MASLATNNNMPFAQAVQTVQIAQAMTPPDQQMGLQQQNQQQQQMMMQQQQMMAQQLQQRLAMEERTMNFLKARQWPTNLIKTLCSDNKQIWKRYFIVDDSGSMNANDGTRLVGARAITCTRWAEQKEAIEFHGELAYQSLSACEFRFLNQPQPICVGMMEDNGESLNLLRGVLSGGPNGGTPLCRHIREIAAEVRKMAPILQQSREKAIVVIFTDGQPSDGNVADALKLLEHLPCWVVVRLCTNEDDVVNYYGDVDSNLEIKLDTLDDLFGEAGEIDAVNDWVTYGLPLQRFREFGSHIKALDMLDESKLSSDHTVEIVKLLLGDAEYAHPEVNFKKFIKQVQQQLKSQQKIFDPVRKRLEPWIKLKKLAKKYGKRGCTIQ